MESGKAQQKTPGWKIRQIWDFQYTGVKDGYLDQTQEDWGVLCSEDLYLDINSFRTKVKQPTGARSRWTLIGKCTACHIRCIVIYECERRYLQEQVPFKFMHNKLITHSKEYQVR